jgi:hypothetical protein
MAVANETDVADLYCETGLPKCVTIRGILERKPFTENFVLHQTEGESEIDKRQRDTTVTGSMSLSLT